MQTPKSKSRKKFYGYASAVARGWSGGSINRTTGPQYAIRNDPLKLKVNTKQML